MEINKDLWRAYQLSYFFLNEPLTMDKFAIITACNPQSQPTNDRENKRNNRLLEQDISAYRYQTLSVGDSKKSWIEESFAVELSQNAAVELVKKYQQNAIYYVSEGQLYLVSCMGSEYSKLLGRFSEKVVYQEQG
ncbi:DUF3293 domain-containing protein [Vibrio sp. SCSIO 43137]|uniref:DUF3293 domain-containing protein n=1 Tax=Vibrio sp. SCSIO 43137 TaxID=3021011 RepID=UPI002307E415|nr:DUF3293 domain-containing protein [Vibrio sp. SCSIO 43137]WCE30202.1 DUF3293 domain-containing protein [Vibrio sp. SCSIO 43137]